MNHDKTLKKTHILYPFYIFYLKMKFFHPHRDNNNLIIRLKFFKHKVKLQFTPQIFQLISQKVLSSSVFTKRL